MVVEQQVLLLQGSYTQIRYGLDSPLIFVKLIKKWN